MIVGRKKEIETLREQYESDKSAFIALYGRRRIGKTFLINETFGDEILFKHAGIYKGSMADQLYSFSNSLLEYGQKKRKVPKNWFHAFEGLKELIKNSDKKKKVVFLDEMAWMFTKGSDLIKALENFWNGWAEARKDVMLIICSSTTSWIINRIIHSKGGLYNRVTTQLYLEPFTLKECEEYADKYGLALNRKQIIEAYMVIGGVPYYWNYIKKGLSIPQCIDSCFFASNAQLKNEFQYIFASLFSKPKDYIEIIKALSSKKYGLTRKEIVEETGLVDNGNFSQKIDDLINCGFIREYSPIDYKKKKVIYQLIDPFTIFYFNFLAKKVNDDNYWVNQLNTPTLNTWQGLAFERVCLIHLNSIKKALGISGVYTSVYPWSCKKDSENGIFGSQIDMVIERKDDIVNLVEIKYYSVPFTLTSAYIEKLEKKKHDYIVSTKTKSSVYLTMIALNGVEKNAYSKDLQSIISIEDLFS